MTHVNAKKWRRNQKLGVETRPGRAARLEGAPGAGAEPGLRERAAARERAPGPGGEGSTAIGCRACPSARGAGPEPTASSRGDGAAAAWPGVMAATVAASPVPPVARAPEVDPAACEVASSALRCLAGLVGQVSEGRVEGTVLGGAGLGAVPATHHLALGARAGLALASPRRAGPLWAPGIEYSAGENVGLHQRGSCLASGCCSRPLGFCRGWGGGAGCLPSLSGRGSPRCGTAAAAAASLPQPGPCLCLAVAGRRVSLCSLTDDLFHGTCNLLNCCILINYSELESYGKLAMH